MRVKVTSPFKDLEAGRYRTTGEVLIVEPVRGARLKAAGCVEFLAEPVAQEAPAEEKPKRKRGRPRKKIKPAEDKAQRALEDK